MNGEAIHQWIPLLSKCNYSPINPAGPGATGLPLPLPFSLLSIDSRLSASATGGLDALGLGSELQGSTSSCTELAPKTEDEASGSNADDEKLRLEDLLGALLFM